MKIQVKKLVGTKWRQISLDNVVGTSILNFILESEDDIIAALFEGDEPVAFVTNNMKHLERYKGSGKLCLDAETLRELVGTKALPSLIARTFPNSSLVEIDIKDDNDLFNQG